MKKIIFSSLALIALSMLLITSCIKKDFDAPPDTSNYDPGLTVNSTIMNLKNKINTLNSVYKIDSDLVISGIVIADDRSGNYYKKMVIQDESSAIEVNIDLKSLYTDYPIGRKIYIKCKGLYLGQYGKYISLGAETDLSGVPSSITSSNISKHIVKANFPNPITPIKVNIAQLQSVDNNKKLLGALIQIDSVQFINADKDVEFANVSTVNRTIEDCDGNSIIIRSSTYANFAKSKTPSGRGNFIGIYTRYNSTPQLVLRDTADLTMTGPLCGSSVLPGASITIDSLRKMYVGSTSTNGIKLSNFKIHGVVTSSVLDSNISFSNMFIQDESNKGIVIYFGTSHGMKLGDSVEVDLTGDSLIVYRETLEIKAKSNQITKISSGKTVTPQTVTLATLNADLSNATYNQRQYEGVVVKVVNATITGTPAFYSGPLTADRSKTVTDATGTITMYTLSKPPYLTKALPVGAVDITAIATKFISTNQIQIRNLNDVQ